MTKLINITFIGLLASLAFICYCIDDAWPSDIEEATAVRCIIGEAGNQGDHGMLVLAEALRNRGTTKGVYGCAASHIDREPAWVFEKARKAWRDSATTNFTNGANFWGSNLVDGKWIKRMELTMTKTYEYRDHQFFKEVKR